jgi:hypothetical protein
MTDSGGIIPREAEFLLYRTEDGRARVEVRFDGETAWLTQAARPRSSGRLPRPSPGMSRRSTPRVSWRRAQLVRRTYKFRWRVPARCAAT